MIADIVLRRHGRLEWIGRHTNGVEARSVDRPRRENHQIQVARFSLLFYILFIGLYPKVSHGQEMKIREQQIRTDDVTLFTRIAGQGTGRILIGIHGGPGNSSECMVSLEKLSSDELTVVTYDQRGTGRSSVPRTGYGLTRHVADLHAIIQALNKDEVDLFGHSWGGVVAMSYAIAHSERVRSLILMGSGPPSMSDVDAGQANLGRRITELQSQDLIPNPLPSTPQDAVRAILPAYLSDPAYDLPAELKDLYFNYETSNQTRMDVGHWDFQEEAGNLSHRVLLLWGENDPFGIEMARATQSALKSARVVFSIIENCGHYWHEQEKLVFEHIKRFLGI